MISNGFWMQFKKQTNESKKGAAKQINDAVN